MQFNKLLLAFSAILIVGCSPLTSEINGPLHLNIDDADILFGEWATLSVKDQNGTEISNAEFVVKSGEGKVKVNKNQLVSLETGTVEVYAKKGSSISNTVTLNITDLTVNPYTDVSEADFYKNYKPATSYMDSYYRTYYNLMSGSIEEQDQYATIEKNRIKESDKFVKNVGYIMSNDQNIYYIYDVNGLVKDRVFKCGGYVVLEEVAAYLTAFNNIPMNYVTDKKTTPTQSPWGKYLRLNHSKFSGDTSKYPYEPVLPNISGCGGSYTYYELDIGTTGTTCDPSYTATDYNNGSKITRGAARIVYSRFEGSTTLPIESKHLFYTDNHYNDFREYLNYYNGWGEIFGNITGGGVISSKTNYNPTEYVEVVTDQF